MPKTPSRLKAPSQLDAVPLPESVVGSSSGSKVGSGSGIPTRKRPLSVATEGDSDGGPLKQIKVVSRNLNSSKASSVLAKPVGKSTSVAVKRTLAPAKENLPKGGNSAATSSANKKKRAAWDTKGRLEDMESLTSSLKTQIQSSTNNLKSISEKLEMSQERVQQLESFRSSLENKVVMKEQEAGSLSMQLQDLKHQLDLKERERSELQDELERKKKSWVSDREDLESKISTLQAEKRAFEATVSNQSSSMVVIESECKALKCQIQALEKTIQDNLDRINSLTSLNDEKDLQIAQLQEKIHKDEQVRRKLHNEIQELKGNIRVFCRVRPVLPSELVVDQGKKSDPCELMNHFVFPDKEKEGNSTDVPKSIEVIQTVESVTGASESATTKTLPFSFDRVFGPDSGQKDVFGEISQLVQSALDGYRVCIFAYGQTNSGKSYTMEGPATDVSNDATGMIPRSVFLIFDTIKGEFSDKGWQYRLEVSYLEIYNETIRDLLVDESDQGKHEIKHSRDGNTTVTDLTSVVVSDPAQVFDLIKKARKQRSVGETQCNERSSRSHSVFMMKLTGENSATGEKSEGHLNLIDLAGSERLSASGSTGDRLKETQHINKSLSSLGDVIFALSSNKDGHIPYRNSKLTYLLQNSLGGNSKVLMFVNVSPLASQSQETLCSLRFATKVNRCQIGTAKQVRK